MGNKTRDKGTGRSSRSTSSAMTGNFLKRRTFLLRPHHVYSKMFWKKRGLNVICRQDYKKALRAARRAKRPKVNESDGEDEVSRDDESDWEDESIVGDGDDGGNDTNQKREIAEVTFRDKWLKQKYEEEPEEVKKEVLDYREKLKDGATEELMEGLSHLSPEEAKPYSAMRWRAT